MITRETLLEASVGILLLAGAGGVLAFRSVLAEQAAVKAEDQAKVLEAREQALDRLEAEVASLRSTVASRVELEKSLGELRPLIAGRSDEVLAAVRASCRKHAAPGTFDFTRDVRALAATELAPGTPRRVRLPVQVTLTTDWEKLSTFLDEVKATRGLLGIDDASFERGAYPLVIVHLTLAVCSGEEASK